MNCHRRSSACALLLAVSVAVQPGGLGQTLEFSQVRRLANGTVALNLTVPTGFAYRLEATPDLVNWSGLMTFATNASGALAHSDTTAATSGTRFYRARQLEGTNIVAGEHLHTSAGDIIVQPRYHASFVMQWNGLMIYNDPDSPTTLYAGLPRADLILLSHEHNDHFDATAIAAVKKPGTVIIAAQIVYNQGSMAPHRAQTTILANGESTNVSGIQVEAVPAYNLNTSGTIYHRRGDGNGYVLTIGGQRIYISGDTQDTPEMRALENIDVAFLCMNLPYTMTVDAAADAVRAFHPRIVYPYHFSNSNLNRFRDLVGSDLGIEVRLRTWY